MRVSEAQYKMLGQLSDELWVSRVEILSSVIGLAKVLVDNRATAVKVVCGDGTEKELLLTLLVRHTDES